MNTTILTAEQQEIARLTAELEALKAANRSKGTGLKVSEKGALSLYGMGRFPVTLYKNQWLRLLEPSKVEAIKQFIKDNDAKLLDKQ